MNPVRNSNGGKNMGQKAKTSNVANPVRSKPTTSNGVNRREFIKSAGFTAAAFALPGCSVRTSRSGSGAAKKDKDAVKPNFLFVLADDFGWSQLGCYGSRFYETANIDRLATEGMRFTDAYAACPVCSPTRASIMTGKYPARLHLTDFIAGGSYPHERLTQPEWQKYLPLEEITIAEVLKAAGYKTASFGKWHLSIAKQPPQSRPYNPDKQGFDESIITYKPKSRQDPEKDAHNVEVITETSLQFLEKNKDRPFFLYVTHNTIHSPVLGKKKLVEKFRNKAGADLPQNNPTIAAMIEELDNSVGRLLRKLDELKIADKTIVIFFSDNGGLERAAKQTPLRSGKANLYEGGIRVPLIVRWPGVTKADSVCGEPVTSVDFFPTFLEILGLESKAKKPIDPVRNLRTPPLLNPASAAGVGVKTSKGGAGRTPNKQEKGNIFSGVDGVSLVPLLAQAGLLNRRAIYWHYPHYHSSSIGPGGAVRCGDYKLIEWFDEPRPPAFLPAVPSCVGRRGDRRKQEGGLGESICGSGNRFELYNLKDDIAEQNNLAKKMPEKTKELKEMLANWRGKVKAQMMTPNPNYKEFTQNQLSNV